MTAVEFLVVYLSAGAPFGVLLFFSRNSMAIQVRVLRSVAASLIWPLLALSWIHQRLLHKSEPFESHDRPQALEHEFSLDPVITEYLTLTTAVHQSKQPGTEPSVGLFEIAGHPNPLLAAKCSARQRDSLLGLRQRASALAFRSHMSRQYFSDPALVEALVTECRRLGDYQTADLIEQPSRSKVLADLPEKLADPPRLAA